MKICKGTKKIKKDGKEIISIIDIFFDINIPYLFFKEK